MEMSVPTHCPNNRAHRGTIQRDWSLVGRLLPWTGIVAPILFSAVFMLDGALKPGYSAMSEAVSYLEVGSYGWVQVLR